MRLRILLIAALLIPTGACDDGSDPGLWDDADAGSGDAADSEPSDSSLEDGASEAETDAVGDTTGAAPLTPEESELILSGDADTRMDIVTTGTPEGDAFLHEVSIEVDPTDPTVRHLVSRMRRTLAASFGGVGIAAPQVGVHRRIFLAQRTDQISTPVQAFFNPIIVEYSPETASQTEGCLSIPGASPRVTRSQWVTIDYDLGDGSPFGETIGSTTDTNAAYAARIVQHEYDHLDGILMTD